MAPRFTVIQGGRLEHPAAVRSVDSCRLGRADAVSALWPKPACNAAIDTLCEPEHLLTRAEPRSSGRGLAVALAWTGEAETGRVPVRGATSLAMPHAVRSDPSRPGRPEDAEAVALVQQAAAEAVARVLRVRLGALRHPIRLVGADEPVRLARPMRPAPGAGRSARPRSVPAVDLVGIRPAGWEAPVAGVRAVAELDAIEIPSAFGARISERPILGDPVEALVRLASRLSRHRGTPRVALRRRAGAVIADVLHRVCGSAAVAKRQARA